METSSKSCQCNACLDRQRYNSFHFTASFQEDVKDFFRSIEIDNVTESLKLVYEIALYQSTEPIEEEQKEALYQIQMLKEGLEKLGKTPI